MRALAELARRGDAAPVPIGDLARARDIPVQFLEGLFATLRRAGILQSQRGVKGGYSFARPPSEVTVLEVVELLEGELGAEAAANGPIWTEAADAVRRRPGRHDDRRRGGARGARLGDADVLHLTRMSSDDDAEIVRSMLETWDTEGLDAARDSFDPDVELVDLQSAMGMKDRGRGPDELGRMAEQWTEIFDDWRIGGARHRPGR